MNKDVFAERIQANPQGVIEDLVAQTTRQGKAIHDLNKEIDKIKKDIKAAMVLLLDEDFRISDGQRYVDFDGREGDKKVWIVGREGKLPEGEKRNTDFFSTEEAVDYFLKAGKYE